MRTIKPSGEDYFDATGVYDSRLMKNQQQVNAETIAGVSGKQGTITASGILKGDGAGGVTAAEAGTDYATPSQIGTLGKLNYTVVYNSQS